MKQEIQKDVTITSKGQLTLPIGIRRMLKLGAKRKVRLEMSQEGVLTMRPLPDVMSFFGSLKNDKLMDPNEKSKARDVMGRGANKKMYSKGE